MPSDRLQQTRVVDLVVPLVASEVNRLLSPRTIQFLVALNLTMLIFFAASGFYLFHRIERIAEDHHNDMASQYQRNTNLSAQIKAVAVVEEFSITLAAHTRILEQILEQGAEE